MSRLERKLGPGQPIAFEDPDSIEESEDEREDLDVPGGWKGIDLQQLKNIAERDRQGVSNNAVNNGSSVSNGAT